MAKSKEYMAAHRKKGGADRIDLTKYMSPSIPYGDVSRAQAGMVFAAYKRGDLEATDQQMSLMYQRYARGKYDFAMPTDDAASIEVASRLRTTINAIAASDYKAANKAFQDFLDFHYLKYDDSTFPDDRKKRK